MQVGGTLLKQVGDVIRLTKENVLSNCPILIFQRSCRNSLVIQYFQTRL